MTCFTQILLSFSCFCIMVEHSFLYGEESQEQCDGDPNKDLNFIKQMVPGIYEIKCIPKNKVYIGQSENLLARFGKHSASLTQNQHDCKELQKDWNIFKDQLFQNFEMRVICSGSEWDRLEKRREKEELVIQQRIKNSFSLYNADKNATFTLNYRRKIKIDGIQYESIAAAARDARINISQTVIRRRLDNPKYPTYKELTRLRSGYKPIVIDGKVFDSYTDVVKSGLAKNRHTVRRRVQSTKIEWKSWQYYKDDNSSIF